MNYILPPDRQQVNPRRDYTSYPRMDYILPSDGQHLTPGWTTSYPQDGLHLTPGWTTITTTTITTPATTTTTPTATTTTSTVLQQNADILSGNFGSVYRKTLFCTGNTQLKSQQEILIPLSAGIMLCQ